MKIKEIIKFLDSLEIEYKFKGELEDEVDGFSSLSNYKSSTITWVKNKSNLTKDVDLNKLKLVVTQDELPNIKNCIITDNSKRVFFSILECFFSTPRPKYSIGHNTYISDNVEIGNNVFIGHNCVLEGDIKIGDNAIIWHNVTIINKVNIGKNCEIQSGNTIGHDGFGYFEDESGNKIMIKHYGGVNIEDNVHIGMNNTIARGTIDDTLIAKGTKIADINHIGHNVSINENCTIISSNIYGSCDIGKNTYITSSTIKNQLKIEENCLVGMGSIVTKNIHKNSVVFGSPARKIRENN